VAKDIPNLYIGDIVSYDTGDVEIPETERHKGRIIAEETFTDESGTRHWVYVRWFDERGAPCPETMRHNPRELRRVT